MVQPVCWIVGAADFDGEGFCPQEGDFVIAADGGYAHLQRLGVDPDMVLGDFDSLDEVPRHRCIVRHPVIKDDPDSLLAVRTALDRGFCSFLLFGCLGGRRLDHTLANIQVLAFLAEKGARGALVGDGRIITAIKDDRLDFDAAERGYLSIFCHGDRAEGVNLRGLKYQLHDAVLDCRTPLGLSNEFLGMPASAEVRRGTLILTWAGGLSRIRRLATGR